MLKIHNDDSIEQYLVKYDMNSDYTYTYNSIEMINDPDLIISKSVSCYPELIGSFEQTSCTPILCNFPGHENGHPDCNREEDAPPVGYDCETYTVYIYEENCGGSSSGTSNGSSNPSNTGGDMPIGGGNQGGGGTANPDLSDPSTTITTPMTIMSQEIKHFINTLPQDQKDWINGLNDCSSTSIAGTTSCNQSFWDDIIGFLSGNLSDDNTRIIEFLTFVNNAYNLNSEIEFEELIQFYLDENIEFLDIEPNSNVPELNSYEDIDIFFENLTNDNFQLTSSEILDQQTSTRKDVIKVPINNFPEATLVASIVVSAPDGNNDGICENFEVFSVNTQLEGLTSLFGWTQTDSPDVSDSNGPTVTYNHNIDTAKIEVYGNFTTGLKFFGEFLQITRVSRLVIFYDLETGQVKLNITYWYPI